MADGFFGIERLLVGDSLVHESDALRFVAVEAFASEEQRARAARADLLHHERRDHRGHDAELDLGEPELAVLRAERHVDRRSEARATAERVAVSLGVPVISVSEEMSVINVYAGGMKRQLQDIGRQMMAPMMAPPYAMPAWPSQPVHDPVEARLAQLGAGDFLHGDAPGLFEIVLVPQLYNARRFDYDLAMSPHLTRIEAACLALPAFAAANPDVQSDAPGQAPA